VVLAFPWVLLLLLTSDFRKTSGSTQFARWLEYVFFLWSLKVWKAALPFKDRFALLCYRKGSRSFVPDFEMEKTL
jgi:hypothetical protein